MLLSGTERGEAATTLLALARFDGQPAVLVGQQRVVGGLVGPAALREARRGMTLAAGLRLPLVLVIDTAGPALSAEAEQGGLAGEIAHCLAELVTLDTPTVSVLLGQGSGGPALAMVPADRVLAALHGWLAPLPPEGASAIVFRDTDHAPELAAAQGIRSVDLLRVRHRRRHRARAPRRRRRAPRVLHPAVRRDRGRAARAARSRAPSGWRPGCGATATSASRRDARAIRARAPAESAVVGARIIGVVSNGDTMALTTAQIDRACGVLLATAAGDALGAPYEFQPARGPEQDVAMVGGGSFGWAAWRVDGRHLDGDRDRRGRRHGGRPARRIRAGRHRRALVRLVANGDRRRQRRPRGVLGRVGARRWLGRNGIGRVCRARSTHPRHTGGNGALMRTAPVALAFLDDEDALVVAARAISALTHFDPDACDACVLWCCAIRHAVLTGELRRARRHAPPRPGPARQCGPSASTMPRSSRRRHPQQRLGGRRPAGGLVGDRRRRTPAKDLPAEHLRRGLDAAVRAGDDTDTVAAIAGGLLGASVRRVGGTRRVAPTAARLARAQGARPGGAGQPNHQGGQGLSRARTDARDRVRHPYDDGVWLGNAAALLDLPDGVDAIVSLCRVHDDDLPAGVEQIDVRLIDQDRTTRPTRTSTSC